MVFSSHVCQEIVLVNMMEDVLKNVYKELYNYVLKNMYKELYKFC